MSSTLGHVKNQTRLSSPSPADCHYGWPNMLTRIPNIDREVWYYTHASRGVQPPHSSITRLGTGYIRMPTSNNTPPQPYRIVTETHTHTHTHTFIYIHDVHWPRTSPV